MDNVEVIPDRAFMNDLKRLDKRLNCYFEREHGHFVVTYKREVGMPIPLFMVQDDDGEFRQPDQRDMLILYLGDRQTEGQSVREHLNHVTSYMDDYRVKIRKQGKDMIKDITRDDKNQLMSAFAKLWGGGKFNSAFRRVTPRSKGKVF